MEEYFMRETVMNVSCAMFDVIRVFPSNAWTHSSLFWFDHSTACNTLCLVGVSELKSLRGQGVSEFRLCLLYTSPSPRDGLLSRMPSSA